MTLPDTMADLSALRFDPLLMLSIVVLAGLAGGWLARSLRVPGITGNIVVGALLGLTVFRGLDIPRQLETMSTFATSLIAVAVGHQFSYRRIRSALKRILSIAILESAMAMCCVGFLAHAFGSDWASAMLLASLAVSTAPATSLAVIREMRAKGPFVKTLLGVVALDAALCITVFAFIQTLVSNSYGPAAGEAGLGQAALATALQFVGSLGIGLVIGLIVERLVHAPSMHKFSTVLIAVVVCAELASLFHLSPLIACLVFGMCLGNTSREAERLFRTLEPIEPVLYTGFFTLAGMSVHLDALLSAGTLCAVYVAARILGKVLGAFMGARISRCSPRIAGSIPFALVPQAGVVLGLLVLLEGDQRIPFEISSRVGSLVVAAVTINEIIGPFFTRLALNRAKEAGLDRPRLMEFLQEEYILTNLEAEDKWEALRKLADFFAAAHRLNPQEAAELYATIEEREKAQSTAMGHGAAIPHGRLNITDEMQGVLGISRNGIPFDGPDGKPVKLVMMIATPTEHEQRHLDVMSGLASMVRDPIVRERLIAAVDPNDAWEIIEDVGARTYNYFLEDVEEEAARP
ncbi:MAG: PTS sugar transporter subunit IIA [Candidatus Hydrogenedentes bacterium]|nr:PTS sugar transporter subunit IIA [Candidatus Hydrogenedentota bacterium]